MSTVRVHAAPGAAVAVARQVVVKLFLVAAGLALGFVAGLVIGIFSGLIPISC